MFTPNWRSGVQALSWPYFAMASQPLLVQVVSATKIPPGSRLVFISMPRDRLAGGLCAFCEMLMRQRRSRCVAPQLAGCLSPSFIGSNVLDPQAIDPWSQGEVLGLVTYKRDKIGRYWYLVDISRVYARIY